MEQNRIPEASQNCFLSTSAAQQAISAVENQIYLYGESEPLMYVCSATSMPPKSAGNVSALRSGEMFATGRQSANESKTSWRKSRKSCTMVNESSENRTDNKGRSPRSAEGETLCKNVASDFKSKILSKFKEFAIISNSSSCSNLEEGSKSAGVGRISANNIQSRSREKKSENKSQGTEELFIHKNNFFTSSSESGRLQIASEDLEDEVFSTGMSDMEEGVNKAVNIKHKSDERAHSNKDNIDATGLPNWFATKSEVENADARMKRPAVRASPDRIGPPVQDRLSPRTTKTTPPPFCLLDELRKNKLVMKEDIFSSNSPKSSEIACTHNAGRSRSNNNGNSKDRLSTRQKWRNVEMTNKSLNMQPASIGAKAGKTNVMEQQNTKSEAAEVYETNGGVENGVDSKARRKQGTSTHPDPPTSEINVQADNIHYIRNQFDESWRPFNLPYQNDCSTLANELIKPPPAMPTTTLSPKGNTALQKAKDPKLPLASPNTRNNNFQPLGKTELTSEQHFNIQTYLDAKTSTPNRRPEKYVKLPGLAEAFVQKDSNFKEIRIKDGTSFESVNALKEMSMRNIENEILELKKTEEYRDTPPRRIANQMLDSKTPTLVDTTDFRTPSKNTKTQTDDSEKIMVDCFVQCESHIVDEANGRNVVKNDHQEIMVCNDNGDGVQLYNKLGHPLTDMDGYLLKDSLGRFLVRLDQYGVPISCTNGQAILMEDSTAWDAVKDTMSIIHQSRKKPIKREASAKNGKARPSLRQLEGAMKNLKNTLEWADKISLSSSRENSLKQFTDFDIGEHSLLRNIKTMDAPKLSNNTTSLITEMKAIAQLRNALLEKVNFIADSRNRVGKSSKNCTLGAETHPENENPQENYTKKWLNESNSIWQGQDRPYSATYQDIRKLKKGEANKEENSRMKSFSGSSLTQNLPTLNQTDGVHQKHGVNLRKNMVSGKRFPIKKKSGENQTKIDWWISGNSLEVNTPPVKKSGRNEENGTHLWDLIHDRSKNNFNSCRTGSYFDDKDIPEINTYQGLLGGPELSDMSLVSKDTDIPNAVSSLKNAKDPALTVTGRQLLISLEKEYNSRPDNSWMDPRKKEKSTWVES